jgi:transposase
MQTPAAVAAMMRLHEWGWGIKRIARALGCSKHTVKGYLRRGGWTPGRPPARRQTWGELQDWLAARFRQHRGDADVGRQELQQVQGVPVSLRTVERAVRPWRQELEAEARATVRVATAPGPPFPSDFGTTGVRIGAEWGRLRWVVATLGYARRTWVTVFSQERQAAWVEGLERALRYVGGGPAEVRRDKPRALVNDPDRATRVVVFNERVLALARYGGFRPRAGAPGRARTKGQDERGVGSVKHTAIAGRRFAAGSELEAPWSPWRRTGAAVRLPGTPGEQPLERFQRAAAAARRAVSERPPFQRGRAVSRRVHPHSWVELDPHSSRVPGRLIGAAVPVPVRDAQGRMVHGGIAVAHPPDGAGRRQRCLAPARRAGGGGAASPGHRQAMITTEPGAPALRRPLAEYAAVTGGGW